MKKLLGNLVLGLLWCNILIAEEYPNSWKMDIHCKQGKWEWHESAFVVNVENNEFSLGPFNRWNKKNFVFKGKIENGKIKITEKYVVYMGEPQPEIIEQYNSMYGKISTPTKKLII